MLKWNPTSTGYLPNKTTGSGDREWRYMLIFNKIAMDTKIWKRLLLLLKIFSLSSNSANDAGGRKIIIIIISTKLVFGISNAILQTPERIISKNFEWSLILFKKLFLSLMKNNDPKNETRPTLSKSTASTSRWRWTQVYVLVLNLFIANLNCFVYIYAIFAM